MGEERVGLDHQVRYYVDYCEIEKTWDVYQYLGRLTFPLFVVACETKESASLIRDALESFPKELEDYL
jgi:hypothetical protein